MPNSLKTKLSKLRYQGKITDEEYKELIDKLRGHDEAIIAQIMWERDIAIEQLKLLGYGLGEKVEKTLEHTDKIEESNFSTEQYKADLQGAYDCGYNCGYADALAYALKKLPSLTPKTESEKDK